LHHVHVQVSVADVAEEAELVTRVALGDERVELRAEGLELGDGERDVVLVWVAGGGEALADALAERPELGGLRPRLRRGGVEREAALEEMAGPGEEVVGVAALDLEEDVVRRGEGEPELAVLDEARSAAVGEELERGDGVRAAAGGAEQAQHAGEVG